MRWRIRIGALFALMMIGLASRAEGRTTDWLRAAPDYVWSFPRDHFPHPDYSIEWWYFTGHLTPRGATEARFGYQFTFFRVGLERPPAVGAPANASPVRSNFAARSLIMGHAAITDLETKRHVFSDVIHRSAPINGGYLEANSERRIGSCPAPFGSSGEWTLDWNGEAFDFTALDRNAGEKFAPGGLRFELSTRPGKPRIFQGPNGLSRKSTDGKTASLYYSFTRLETVGKVELFGESFDVTGTSWMDHEISSDSLSDAQVGWDWFSLQLDDGSEIMLYQLRGKDRKDDVCRGTHISPTGEVTYLERADWTARPTRTAESTATGAEYPVAWSLSLPRFSLELEVEAQVDDAENVATNVKALHYWEGPIRITTRQGKKVGSGYLELTGYGGARLPL